MRGQHYDDLKRLRDQMNQRLGAIGDTFLGTAFSEQIAENADVLSFLFSQLEMQGRHPTVASNKDWHHARISVAL